MASHSTEDNNRVNEHTAHGFKSANKDSLYEENIVEIGASDKPNVSGDSIRSNITSGDEQMVCDDKIPDGGYGWVIVAGAFLVQITSFGIATAWGVMQDYFERDVFGDKVADAPFQLSFVGTLCLIFSNCMGSFGQILGSILGTRIVLLIGTFLITVGMICAGFSTQIWHLYLTQGICFGIGVSFTYVTIMAVAPQYFDRKRGFALGLITSGAGIGGLIMPFVMTPINRSLGGEWTYRILGFICLACGLVACCAVKDRIPRPKGRKKLGDIIKFDVFKNKKFCIWCGGAIIQMSGYFIPYFFVPSHATYLGLTDSQGSSMIAVSAATNSIGRVVSGYLADRMGPINTNILFLIVSGLSSFLIWGFAYTYSTLMAFMAIFGFFCGSYFALLTPITASILGMTKFPSGLSLILLGNAVAVFGPNIASAIEGAVGGIISEPFFTYKMFSGATYILGALVMLWLKLSMNRTILCKV